MTQQEMLNIKPIEEMLTKLTVESVFGKPTTENGVTIIPVAQVQYGFGYGSGYGHGPNGQQNMDEDQSDSESTGEGGGGGGRSRWPCYPTRLCAHQHRGRTI
jgi:uncharacterized spore protein YtfJ